MNYTKPTLVFLAAGLGSRYGGLKQIDAFTDDGDTLIDFSIYDALQAGFGTFIFIIRKAFEKEFKSVFDQKLKGKAEVIYVFQELDNVPEPYINPKRTKPWGTGHALLMVKDMVKDNFAIINADDFYGRDAFKVMAETLAQTDKNSYDFAMIAYRLKNTVSDYGYVSRGECIADKNDYLVDITERTHIEKADGTLVQNDNGTLIPMDRNTIVSMNFWGFTPKCFAIGTTLFTSFLEAQKDNPHAEFFIPSIVQAIIKSDKARVKVLKSDAQWFGVTYIEDKTFVQDEIKKLKDSGVYPNPLWSDE